MIKTTRIAENTLKNMNESLIRLKELKRKLSKQIGNSTLMRILGNLEEENKILFTSRGITWIYSNPIRIRKMLKNSLEI